MNDVRSLDRILVVDDEPQILSSIQDLLEDDFDVVTCSTAEEALSHLGKNHIAAILSDQRMPGMNGDEFLEKAREVSEATRVLITGYADLEAVVRAVNNGQIYAYVSKPWDPHHLKIMVERAVEHYELLDKLRHEKNLMTTLMESATDAILFKDADRRYVRANKMVARYSQVDDVAELIGKRTEELDNISEREAAIVLDQDQRVLTRGESIVDEIECSTFANGATHWFSTSKAPVVGPQGQIKGIVGIARDVTDRFLAEEALKESEERFRDFAATASDWFWETDENHCFTWFSERFEKVTGLDRNEYLGRRRDTVGLEGISEDDLRRHAEDLDAHRPFRNFVYARRRPDGRQVWLSINGSPRFDETGNFIGYRGTGTDVTRRKRAEEAVALITSISLKLGSARSMDEAFKITLKSVCEKLGWTLGEVWMHDQKRDELELLSSWALNDDESTDAFRSGSGKLAFLRDQGLPGRAWHTRKPEWVGDLLSESKNRFHRTELAAAAGLKAACAIPVVTDERVAAVLVFFLRNPNDDDAAWMDALGAAVAPLGSFLLRIAAEQAQRESEKRFREFTDIGTDWLWEMDADLRFSWFSDQVENILGISKNSLVGRRREETLLEGVDDEALKHHIEDLEAHRPFRDFVHARRREDNGELVWISINGDPFFDEDNNFLGYRGVGTDITNRKRAEAQIESLARYHSENPSPVLRIFEDGVIHAANKASAALLNIWKTGNDEKAPDPVAAMVKQLLAENVSQQLEVEGNDLVFRLNLVPIRDLGYVNVYGQDITVEKKAEQKLRQVQKMEAIGQLTGGVAHDFNNRLTVMMGNLELLEDKLAGDEKSLKLVKAARRAAEGGAKLTRQLLTFSRRQMLEPEVVEVNALLNNLKDMISRTLGETVEVTFKLEDDAWPVFTDAGQLEDAIINLAVNARDAMPAGGKLTIETDNVDLTGASKSDKEYMLPGEYLMIAVTDTGEGIPKEVQERIFEPFFSTKETGKGTGLGMAMVYGFAKQSKGYVNIYSEVGRGTCIKIYLPRHDAPIRADEARPMDDDTGRNAGDAEKTVLVVEDEPGVREIAVQILSNLGFRVLEAENPLQALETVERGEEFDLLFTDMVMPGGLTGLELAQKVKTQRPEIKVIYTSGYTEKGPFNGHSGNEPIHWITKPYTRDKLVRKVREALSA